MIDFGIFPTSCMHFRTECIMLCTYLAHEAGEPANDVVREAEDHPRRLADDLEEVLAGEDGDAGDLAGLARVEVGLAGQHGQLASALTLLVNSRYDDGRIDCS